MFRINATPTLTAAATPVLTLTIANGSRIVRVRVRLLSIAHPAHAPKIKEHSEHVDVASGAFQSEQRRAHRRSAPTRRTIDARDIRRGARHRSAGERPFEVEQQGARVRRSSAATRASTGPGRRSLRSGRRRRGGEDRIVATALPGADPAGAAAPGRLPGRRPGTGCRRASAGRPRPTALSTRVRSGRTTTAAPSPMVYPAWPVARRMSPTVSASSAEAPPLAWRRLG